MIVGVRAYTTFIMTYYLHQSEARKVIESNTKLIHSTLGGWGGWVQFTCKLDGCQNKPLEIVLLKQLTLHQQSYWFRLFYRLGKITSCTESLDTVSIPSDLSRKTDKKRLNHQSPAATKAGTTNCVFICFHCNQWAALLLNHLMGLVQPPHLNLHLHLSTNQFTR